MKVKIYRPSKNVMQSGRGRGEHWVLEYETPSKRSAEPLMGWTASGDTLNQVRLKFDSREQAIAFAEKKGWAYDVSAAQERSIKPRNYSDNFKYVPHKN